MLDGQPISIFGDGTSRRDYTYIEDIVSGVRAAMEYTRTPYEVINLGNNQTVSLAEMVDGLEQALGVRALTTRLPNQPGDVPQTWANVDKAAKLLGYAPRTSYARGVARFADWLKAGAIATAKSVGVEPTRLVPVNEAPSGSA